MVISEGHLGTAQVAHTLHTGLWVVVMSEGHLGTAQAAHTLHHSSEDAFLYTTHMGPPTRSQCPLTNTEMKDYISPIMSDNFPGWQGRSWK